MMSRKTIYFTQEQCVHQRASTLLFYNEQPPGKDRLEGRGTLLFLGKNAFVEIVTSFVSAQDSTPFVGYRLGLIQ